MIDVWNEIAYDKLKVGMSIGVVNGNVIEKGKIISIEDGFVRVMHSSKSVSAYQLGYFKFAELAWRGKPGLPPPGRPKMNNTYNILDGQKIITDYGISVKGHLVIPNEIEGLPVTSIGNWAFYDCRILTSISIPDSVTSIGDRAFMQCFSLSSINIPNSITSIGKDAFRGCYSLTSIQLPKRFHSESERKRIGLSSEVKINE